MQYQLPHHCFYTCFQTSWAGNTDPVLLFSVQHSAQKHSHMERMLTCDSVRQTRELTYMTGQASACSHPCKFTTWRSKRRRRIVSSKWRRLSRKEEGHSGNVGLGLYLQRLEVLHGYVSQYRRGIWCKNSFKSQCFSLSLSLSHTRTHPTCKVCSMNGTGYWFVRPGAKWKHRPPFLTIIKNFRTLIAGH